MILVCGASGNVGSEVVAQLVAAKEAVRALVRKPKAGTFPAAVEVAAGDLDQPDALGPALTGVRRVFLLGGHRDMPGLLAKIREAKVEHVVLLSSRSVMLDDASNAVVKMWLDSEAAVRASGVPWTFVRASGFASNALRWLPQLQAGNVVRAPFANAAIASIDPADIAAVAALALTQDGHAGQSYALSGPEPQTPEKQVQILARVLARELRFEAQPDAEAFAETEKSGPPGFADAFRRFFVLGEFDDALVSNTVRELTGNAPRTFEQWATAHAADFRQSAREQT